MSRLGWTRIAAESLGQLVADPLGNVLAMAGVDELKQHELSEQHSPAIAEAAHQALPVESGCAVAEVVGDVGHIAAVALQDEGLLPDGFFGGAEEQVHAQHFAMDGVLEPRLVDMADAVARVVNDVDKVVAAEGFAKPVWEGD